jgi:hypothetical protein
MKDNSPNYLVYRSLYSAADSSKRIPDHLRILRENQGHIAHSRLLPHEQSCTPVGKTGRNALLHKLMQAVTLSCVQGIDTRQERSGRLRESRYHSCIVGRAVVSEPGEEIAAGINSHGRKAEETRKVFYSQGLLIPLISLPETLFHTKLRFPSQRAQPAAIKDLSRCAVRF